MALMDAFTGAPQLNAGAANRGVIAGLFPSFVDWNAAGHATNAADLGQGYGASTGAINTGATGALNYLDTGATGAQGQLDQAKSTLTANGGAFAPLSALAGQFG